MDAHSDKQYTTYEPDEDAQYDQVVEIDLSEVRPTVAFPHLPGNAKTIDEVEAMEPIKIDQVVIGSCTNGRISDIEKGGSNFKRTYRSSGCTCYGCSCYTGSIQRMYQRRSC